MSSLPKACEKCPSERVTIGKTFYSMSPLRRYGGTALIYIPIIVTVPFVVIGAWIMYAHLKLLGAQNLKRFSDFTPAASSHRYAKFSDQITFKWDITAPWLTTKSFWKFNCSFYCPLSVALFEWSTYLVKMVENFWCPFFHGRKEQYASSAIDKSYWHIHPEYAVKLHPDDYNCSTWNEDATENSAQGSAD